ncbi:undecaprenyldiphospho-muramoylpentapeptide beta-N-acetylglucosaminyltransferase [Echinicola strongylocentroti]|uniref:UDP-N-acetylglucosamine--N-acetylmuramyl-(pentapeptide) pyrophosphoryl-undecaprenol N-acetylglucosamine transferase n=1 Tax=Echinicola strongylocentroti TaxID=1795355 RepID=A0A2Z4IGI1_9BACT|nr:undecaprenyldiphospho-muramoylpentapeptide beta-N-acetylglucosaminyltransferase [Echinicola strongylocentroti]AWW30084.1 undecaprenyldiphospho-muramoylpentapeptide beta-N-acetylglucosaminyltransferase [Echinicola strongylocentroti]
MTKEKETYRIMISGGGTGGHIYPAIAIANAWAERYPESEILFVGAEGKMEMQKVPEAGYAIEGLPVAGLQRRFTWQNLSFPFKLWDSVNKAKKLIKRFKPHAVVGVGGFASGPLLYVAQKRGVPTLIQEQNSFAGLTNKLLAKKADAFCVAYEGMDKFFPVDKIHFTGNPVRKDILHLDDKKEQAIDHFGLDADRQVILVLGGSLGARTINNAVVASMKHFEKQGYQVLWQTGRFYFEEMTVKLEEAGLAYVQAREFIREMDLAYAAADVVISRAGALSVSELSLVAKPVIFIPSPNVAEDHQTKNALACVNNDAAVLLKDEDAVEHLVDSIDQLMADTELRDRLGKNIKKMGKPDAALEIVKKLEALIK